MFLLTLALLAASIPGAQAIETPASALTVDQAIQEARSRSPEYQRVQAAADEASARTLDALSGHLPHLSMNASYLTNHKFLLFPINGGTFEAPNPISLIGVSAGINVFDSGMTINAYRSARMASQAADHESEHALLELENGVRIKFYQALSAQLLSDVTDQNVKTLQDHLAKTKALLSGGATTKLDTLRVEVQLSEALPDQIQAHDNVFVTRKVLAQAMGLDEDNRPLTGTLPTPDPSRLPGDLRLEVARRADIQAAQERAEAADKARLSSLSSWLPRVTFAGDFQYYNNLDNTLNADRYNSAYTLGFNLTWSLFDAGNLARVREASARATQAEKAAQAALQRAPVDFELYKRRYLSNASLYHARNQAIESATESVRLARISYEAGTRTSTEVLDAELDLFRARAGVVRAQLESAEALLNLELALGRHL